MIARTTKLRLLAVFVATVKAERLISDGLQVSISDQSACVYAISWS